MKKALSYVLLTILLIIYLILGGIASLLKYMQIPFQSLIEKLDKIIYKLNTQS